MAQQHPTVSWFSRFVLSEESKTMLPRVRGALLQPLPHGRWFFCKSADLPLVATWRQMDWQKSRTDAYHDERWPEKIWLVHEREDLFWISKDRPLPNYVCTGSSLKALALPFGPRDQALTFYARSSHQRKITSSCISLKFVVKRIDPLGETNSPDKMPQRVFYDRVQPGAVAIQHRGCWGRWLVTAFGKSLRLWDLSVDKPTNGREFPVYQENQAHPSGVGRIVALGRTGAFLTTGKSENNVFVWVVRTSPEDESKARLDCIEMFTFYGSSSIKTQRQPDPCAVRLIRDRGGASGYVYYNLRSLRFDFVEEPILTPSPPKFCARSLWELARARYALQLLESGEQPEMVRDFFSRLEPANTD